MTIGIYQISQHSISRVLYVGSSQNVERRLKDHFRSLRREGHENQILQRAWNKYGNDDFLFEILEETDLEHLLEREQFWLDALSPHCNLGPVADNPM